MTTPYGITDLPREIWKDIPAFKGRYQVSNLGRVKRLPLMVKQARGSRLLEERIATPTPLRSGHLHVNFRDNGKSITVLVHRLVLEAFVGPCPAGMECCHRDDDPTNNALCNLYWGTRKNNIEDRRRNGILVVGEKATGAKLTADNIREIRERLERGESQAELARQFGICGSHIFNIANRKVWTHV